MDLYLLMMLHCQFVLTNNQMLADLWSLNMAISLMKCKFSWSEEDLAIYFSAIGVHWCRLCAVN